MLYKTFSRATRVYSGNFKSTAAQTVDWCGRAPSVSGLRAVTSSVGRCVFKRVFDWSAGSSLMLSRDIVMLYVTDNRQHDPSLPRGPEPAL